jgi:hypothetical protein|tara:strand:- start:563 stop:769 length:207 start_codon:yes stop_codon:yes gene_type:complete
MFTYKIHKETLTDGIRLVMEGEKENIKHEFITKLSDSELQKVNYEDFISNLALGLEKKIDLLIMDNIY